jgi:hypothetical protein
MPRCGTNFAENQLILSPDCASPGPIWEDFLVSNSATLERYAKNAAHYWNPDWFGGSSADYQSRLEKSLGGGIESFLLGQLPQGDDVDYLISKTPTVRGIENVTRFFEDAKLIIIVRDGRAVVESGQRSFDWDFDKAIVDWKTNAKKIQQFMQENPGRALLVKYEDLFVAPEATIREICDYLELDFSRYPLDAMRDVPVSGSSDLKNKDGEVHWQAVKKDETFDPLKRFSSWSSWKHKVFDYLAGKEMSAFGYETKRDLSALDQLTIPLYLLTWPVRALPAVVWHAIKNRKLTIKTH